MAAKRTTRITGLLVDANAIYHLHRIYFKTSLLLQKFPPQSSYRKKTEDIIQARCQVVNEYPNSIPDIEREINCGQIEELILQGEKELHLARKMLLWKPWEKLIEKPPENQWRWPPVK